MLVCNKGVVYKKELTSIDNISEGSTFILTINLISVLWYKYQRIYKKRHHLSHHEYRYQ